MTFDSLEKRIAQDAKDDPENAAVEVLDLIRGSFLKSITS